MKKTLALLAALTLALSGCATTNSGTDKVNVLASFYPLQFLAQEIGGQAVTVESPTPAGAEPHDLELSTKDVASLSKADAVIYQKGFQKAVDQAIAQAEPSTVADVSKAASLVPIYKHESANATKSQDLDPHFWLDPVRLEKTITPVLKALQKAAPELKKEFAKNARALSEKLKKLDANYATTLADCKLDKIVVSHEAYGYLAERYHFSQLGLSGFDPEQEASPAQLSKIQGAAKSAGVEVIFSEDLINQKTAKTMAKDLGIKSEVLDPLESKTGKGDYLQVMDSNLRKVAKALKCKTN